MGFQREAGAKPGSSATFRGPLRRSYKGAMVLDQVLAAIARSPSVIRTCISFSASAKVAGETAGPADGPSPNAEGIPAGASPPCCAVVATAEPRRNKDVWVRNCLRDLDMALPMRVLNLTESRCAPTRGAWGRRVIR